MFPLSAIFSIYLLAFLLSCINRSVIKNTFSFRAFEFNIGKDSISDLANTDLIET